MTRPTIEGQCKACSLDILASEQYIDFAGELFHSRCFPPEEGERKIQEGI